MDNLPGRLHKRVSSTDFNAFKERIDIELGIKDLTSRVLVNTFEHLKGHDAELIFDENDLFFSAFSRALKELF